MRHLYLGLVVGCFVVAGLLAVAAVSTNKAVYAVCAPVWIGCGLVWAHLYRHERQR